MTVRHMRIFCAVCENDCSTTKAAAQLNMSQPAVSLAVKELENYYEVRLFDRIGRQPFHHQCRGDLSALCPADPGSV